MLLLFAFLTTRYAYVENRFLTLMLRLEVKEARPELGFYMIKNRSRVVLSL